MERDSSGSRSRVRSRVRAGEFGTAGFFLGREFHEFDACVVRVVEVELPFAVAAQFGLLRWVSSRSSELPLRSREYLVTPIAM